jgi:hypothetical protein
VSLDGVGAVFDGVAVDAFGVLRDLAVEIVHKTVEICQILFLWDEHAVRLEHVFDVGVDVVRLVLAEKAAGCREFLHICILIFLLFLNSGTLQVVGYVTNVGLDGLSKGECGTQDGTGITILAQLSFALFVLGALDVVLVGVLAVESLIASVAGTFV